MKYEAHLITPQWITLIFSNTNPIFVSRDDARYPQVKSLLDKQRFDELPQIVDRSTQIVEYTKGKFLVRNGVVIIDEESLPETLSDKLLQLIDANEDTTALERFWQNLRQNPSEDSRRDLFAFLRANKIPITMNGCFIAYKKVRPNYKDCRTGRISNKPGQIVKMERNRVDADRNRTCSSGLHVAAFSYADRFQAGRMLEVEVNPRDVVAVPPDYNEQKMRVCRYRVIRIASDGELNDLVYRRERKIVDHSETE